MGLSALTPAGGVACAGGPPCRRRAVVTGLALSVSAEELGSVCEQAGPLLTAHLLLSPCFEHHRSVGRPEEAPLRFLLIYVSLPPLGPGCPEGTVWGSHHPWNILSVLEETDRSSKDRHPGRWGGCCPRAARGGTRVPPRPLRPPSPSWSLLLGGPCLHLHPGRLAAWWFVAGFPQQPQQQVTVGTEGHSDFLLVEDLLQPPAWGQL